ncbi:MAG: hypothetical protein GY857_07045 [Desulfobacula sp.]|nr:hypothetical protein [Desulfobacula sp.]
MIDPRCKLFIICIISISMLSAPLLLCLLYFIILLIFLKNTGLNIFTALNSIKYFLVLLFFVFAARSLTTEGDIIFSFFHISITKQGLNMGFLIAFKFFLIMLTGLIVSLTTKPSLVKGAVQWFLKPVPFIPEKRVGVMISLALKFMPLILKQANEISNARKARCGDLEKNPVKKIIGLVLPLLKKTFFSADNLVFAMESRCYDDDRTDPEFKPSGKEMIFSACSLVLASSFVLF